MIQRFRIRGKTAASTNGREGVRILVTGGFGYVGGRLAKVLNAEGHSIVLGSRRHMTSPQWLPRAEMVRVDFDNAAQMRAICEGVDAVAHLAGVNAEESVADPAAALAFNGSATARLARSAAQAGVQRFLHLSTAHVYGTPLTGTIGEDACPRSLHPYATSHRAGEDAVRWLHERRELVGVVARLSNAFGAPTYPGVNCWMLLLNDLCLQAVRSHHMALHTSGIQRRDFISLTEACRALVHLLAVPAERVGNGVFNVGGGWSPTILEITKRFADRVERVLGVRPAISVAPIASQERNEPLRFDRRKLLDSGFIPETANVIDEEMDSLIEFCALHSASLAK
jgi:UDP-glucose 4-epimerase